MIQQRYAFLCTAFHLPFYSARMRTSPKRDWLDDVRLPLLRKRAGMKLIHATVVVAFCRLSMAVAQADDAGGASIPQLQSEVDAVLSKVLPSVVGLSKDGRGHGSGVIVTEDGIILTNGHHGFMSSDSLAVVLSDGRAASAHLRFFKNSQLYDYSVLQIDGKGTWPHVELGEAKRVRPVRRGVCIWGIRGKLRPAAPQFTDGFDRGIHRCGPLGDLWHLIVGGKIQAARYSTTREGSSERAPVSTLSRRITRRTTRASMFFARP